MELKLFHTVDNDNVINKDLTLLHTTNINLKDTTSLINPTLILTSITGVNLFQCNYCYLSEFNRYYFIRDIEVMNNKNVRFLLEVDVLESFKEDILQSEAVVTKQSEFNPYYDYNSKSEVRKEVDIYNSDVSLSDGKMILLTTIGGV